MVVQLHNPLQGVVQRCTDELQSNQYKLMVNKQTCALREKYWRLRLVGVHVSGGGQSFFKLWEMGEGAGALAVIATGPKRGHVQCSAPKMEV
jgi:hypothetical protein